MTASNVTLRVAEDAARAATSFPAPFPQPAWKRNFDVFFSIVLLVLCFPLFVLVAVTIKIDSDGPVFFRQWRIGQDGIPFRIWKFRSMFVNAPAYERSPAEATDPRLTRVGRVIRRLSVDELPQLWNVLCNDMSLVGPRPEMPYIVESYTAEQQRRLAVKPGVTGQWQISPDRSRPIHENVHHDLNYIRNRSLSLDCIILLKTLFAVVRGV
jgi:lipopolysaccharide/colanic/teichoic acid biosynthesis glycosyltransferase